jgi:hypothetical protein
MPARQRGWSLALPLTPISPTPCGRFFWPCIRDTDISALASRENLYRYRHVEAGSLAALLHT